ncbi:hypothetical protein [Parasphingorhabdus sp.]|uniref:hypothetical protein n=1 Tax=Parasphingorhabdus sp. TaxID=2709688 RepID=UPI00329997DF
MPNLFVMGVVITLLASWLFEYLKSRQNKAIVLKILETQSEINIDQIRQIVQPPKDPLSDLRRGVLLLGLGIACAVAAMGMMDPEYRFALLGLSAFPFTIGSIHLLFHFFVNKRGGNGEV